MHGRVRCRRRVGGWWRLDAIPLTFERIGGQGNPPWFGTEMQRRPVQSRAQHKKPARRFQCRAGVVVLPTRMRQGRHAEGAALLAKRRARQCGQRVAGPDLEKAQGRIGLERAHARFEPHGSPHMGGVVFQ